MAAFQPLTELAQKCTFEYAGDSRKDRLQYKWIIPFADQCDRGNGIRTLVSTISNGMDLWDRDFRTLSVQRYVNIRHKREIKETLVLLNKDQINVLSKDMSQYI